MSRKNNLTCTFSLLISMSLPGFLLASGRSLGQDQREQQHVPAPRQPEMAVTVLVHNYVRLPEPILGEAKERASLIFSRAGVEITFVDCPLKDEDPSLYPGCPQFSDVTQLFLRILPTSPGRTTVSGEAVAAARIAHLYWNRIEEQARRLSLSIPRILAHTLAHELGHLLLGSNSHSPTGIMTARWDARSATCICQDGLYFDTRQSETIEPKSEGGEPKQHRSSRHCWLLRNSVSLG